MQISLAYRQKKILEFPYKMCRKKNECDTIKAILLPDEGWSEEMISAALRKHQTTINTNGTKKVINVASYIGIKATLPSDEPILFMDATQPIQATKLSCAWIHTGTDKPIETTGSRA